MRKLVYRGANLALKGSESYGAKGILLTCPKCGEQWGKILLSSSDAGEFINGNFYCLEHGNRYRRGGSFIQALLWWDRLTASVLEACLANFPEAALVHEAFVLAVHIERLANDNL